MDGFQPLRGGCACGGVRYRVTAVPEFYRFKDHWPAASVERYKAAIAEPAG